MADIRFGDLYSEGDRVFRPTKPKWHDGAICRGQTDLFFAEVHLHASVDAKKMCRRCPVRRDCLTWAMTHDEHGIWGGLTATERREAQFRRMTVNDIVAKA